MTLPVPSQQTVSVGQRLQASMWNDDVRDAVAFLASPPMAFLTMSAAQSIPNTTETAFAFNTEVIDTYNGHDTVTNNSRYTCQVDGTYLVIGQTTPPANGTGFRQVRFWKNGSTPTPTGAHSEPANAAAGPITQAVALITCSANDYIELAYTQTSGVALSVTASMQVLWVHA